MYREEKAPPVVKRLIALLSAGYRIREQDFADADIYLSLEHPAHWQKVKEKSLYLYDDGSVMGGPRADSTCLLIKPDEAPLFQEMLLATPKPTWWERNHGPFYAVWAWIVIGAFMFAFVKLFDFVWDVLLGK